MKKDAGELICPVPIKAPISRKDAEPIMRRAALICSQTSTTKPTQNFVDMERSGVQAGTTGMSSAFRSGNTEAFCRLNQLRHRRRAERRANGRRQKMSARREDLRLLVPSGLRAPDRRTLLTLWTAVIMRQSDAGVQLPALFLGTPGQRGRKSRSQVNKTRCLSKTSRTGTGDTKPVQKRDVEDINRTGRLRHR